MPSSNPSRPALATGTFGPVRGSSPSIAGCGVGSAGDLGDRVASDGNAGAGGMLEGSWTTCGPTPAGIVVVGASGGVVVGGTLVAGRVVGAAVVGASVVGTAVVGPTVVGVAVVGVAVVGGAVVDVVVLVDGPIGSSTRTVPAWVAVLFARLLSAPSEPLEDTFADAAREWSPAAHS